MPQTETEPIYKPPYTVQDGCLCEEIITRNGVTLIKLADFVPVLTAEITRDDGIEQTRLFRVKATHESGEPMPEVTVTAEEMTAAKWMLSKWGALGAPMPKHSVQSKICHAILNTCSGVKQEIIYQQTGWHKINGAYHYLLPCKGSPYTVQLSGKLTAYHFAEPCRDLSYMTGFLQADFAPKRVIYPLLALTCLTPLNHFLKAAGCEPKFVTALVGRSGQGKSTLTALFLSFFGTFRPAELPMSFHDTANSILANIYYLKDVLTCIDDFHPSGSYAEQDMKEIAQCLSRFYGDHIGRARLNTKAELQPSRPPTGNAIITAEYVPEISVSGSARYFTIELREHDVNFQKLESFSRLAEQNVLCGIMRTYVDWLKDKLLCSESGFLELLRNQFAEKRSVYTTMLHENHIHFHNRVPEMLAHLRIGFDFLMLFLTDSGVITNPAAEQYSSELDRILIETVRTNADLIQDQNPTAVFLEKLQTLLESGRCYVLPKGSSDAVNKGFIGLSDEQHYYLIANAIHPEVRKLCAEQGEHFTITKNQLIRQLADEGIIERFGTKNTTSIRMGAKTLHVIVIDKSRLQ